MRPPAIRALSWWVSSLRGNGSAVVSQWSAAARTRPDHAVGEGSGGGGLAATGRERRGDEGGQLVADAAGEARQRVVAHRPVEQRVGDDEAVDLGVLLDQGEVGVDGRLDHLLGVRR